MNIDQAKALAFPAQVMIQTTSRCNSACVICPYPLVQKNLTHGDMDDSMFASIIDEIAGYPVLDRLMLYLMNEPLCDKKIIDRIRYARSKLPETEIYILTNGINLTDKMGDRLIESGLSWIGLSVHAIEDKTYKAITNRSDFEKIKKKMTRFVEKALDKRGADFLQVNITRVRPHVCEEEFAKAADFWRSLGLTRVDTDNGYISRAGNVAVHGHDPVKRDLIKGCDTLWAYKMAHVLFDGTVIPCCMDWSRKVVWGNVAKTSLLDAWRGKERRGFLDALASGKPLPDDFLCKSCEDAIPAPVIENNDQCKTCEKETTDEKADILLVNPPPWLPYGPPLGLASLSAYLEERGFVADILDANIELYSQTSEANKKLWDWEQGLTWEKDYEVDRVFGKDLDAFAQRIAHHPAKVVGFSVASRKEYPLARIIKTLVKLAPEKTLLLGGPGVSDRTDRDRVHQLIASSFASLENEILYGFVIGEGEATLAQTMENLRLGETMEGIDGLAVYKQGGQAFYQPRKEIADLKDLPFPDFSKMPMEKYTHPSLTVEWSRGCIGNCTFCNIKGLWGRFRTKPASRVLDELEHLTKTFNKNWLSVCDPVINGRPKVLEEICRGIIERRIEVKWAAGISPNRELTFEQFELMQKAGCYRLEFGIESASENVLNKMGKRYNAQTAGQMISDCKKAGIEVVLYLIVGYPSETDEDFQQTLEFLSKYGGSVDLVRSVNGLILVPGSPIEQRPEDFGIDLPDRAKNGWVSKWTARGIEPKARVERINRVIKLLESLSVPVEFSNKEELLDDKEFYGERVVKIETRLAEFEIKMKGFIELQEKVLRGEPIRKNPYSDEVALVICPVWGTQNPPLGISYVASFLRNQGWNPYLVDYNIELFVNSDQELRVLFEEENFRHWTDPESFSRIRNAFSVHIDQLVDRLISSDKKVIGFSVYSPNRLFTIEVCRRIKLLAPDRILVAGGRGVFTENERLLFPPDSIDYFVVGDGEVTFVPLLESIFSNRDGAKLPGVVRFEGHHLTPLSPRPIYEDLTIFPHPTWEGLNLDLYTADEIPLLFSRGCISHCTFCNDHKAMGRYRNRPAEHMAAEVFWHVRTLNRRSFKFNDQLINGDLENLERFCDLIIEEGEEIKWIALAQPRGDMPDRLLQKMKAAGCFTLNLGLESGSDSILKRMGKGFTVQDMEKALKQIFESGINTMGNFIAGFPGETEADLLATMDFIKRNRPWICGVTSVNTCIVLEGSPLFLGAKSFDIQFPKTGRDVGWWSQDNTLSLRNERAIRLVALLDELDIPHLVSNLREKVADLDSLHLPTATQIPQPPQVDQKEDSPCADPSCLPPEDDFDPEKGKPYFEDIDLSPSDILLMMLPSWGTDVPPLGISYLAQSVDESGQNATVLDLNIKYHNRAKDRTLWRMESYKYWTDPELINETFDSFADLTEHYISQIAKHPAPVLGFSVLTGNFPFTIYFADKLRKAAPDKTIIFGGPGITNSFDIAKVTKDHCDYLVLGDGEIVLVQILKSLKTGKVDIFDGVIPVGDPIDFNNLPKALVRDLDALPFPTFSQVNINEYMSDATPILTSRGCIRRCAFCNDHHIGQKYRPRDPKKIFKEIEYHVKNRGTDRFTLLDVLINGRPALLEKFCDLIIDSGYQIRWGGQGVIRKEMTLELLKKMKAAGCMSMVYGIESFSDKVLKLMNKPYTQELAKEILSRTHQTGIETIINVLVGFPGETEEEYSATYDFIRDHQDIIDQVASISPCLINLGSRLFERYQEYGVRFPLAEGSIKWDTQDGNTFEIRRRRVLELTTLLARRDKSVHTINLYDEKREDFETMEHEEFSSKEPIDEASQYLSSPSVDGFLVLLPPWGVQFPPLGIASLATYAQANEFNVKIEDKNIDWYDKCGDHFKSWWDPEKLKFWMPGENLEMIINFLTPEIDKFLGHIKSTNPKLVGFSTNESNLHLSQIIAQKVKKLLPDIKVIFGGPGVAWPLDRAEISPDSIDGFVVGEGEVTFVEILSRIRGQDPINKIDGFILPGSDIQNDLVPRELIRPLELIPAPEFKDFPLHLYTQKDIPLLFSRGCIGRCAFCNDYLTTPKFRIKKPETLFEEVQKYKNELGAFEFAFNDLLVNADLKALEGFCDLVIQNDLRLAWTGQAVIDKKMDKTYMDKLAKAGCVSLVFGAESFSTAVLKKMRKRFAPNEAVSVFKAAKSADIDVIVNIIVGFPGEGEKEFEQTLSFIEKNHQLIDRVSALSSCIVVAQSDLEKRPENYNIVLPKPEHWKQWYSSDKKNTYEIRAKRMEKVLALLGKLSIPHNMTNRYLEILESEC